MILSSMHSAGEPSARKFIVPFRADLVEKWDIRPGALVTGRPAGPGCPIVHALRVLAANPVTGVLECHTVGPLAARKKRHSMCRPTTSTRSKASRK